MRSALIALVAVQLICVGAASAAWSGTADYFDFANGGSDNGLFGEPQLVGGNTFVFTPNDFRAESTDGVAATAQDRLFIDITMHTNAALGGILIQERGAYGITGQGSVSASGDLVITDLSGLPRSTSAPLVTNPVFPVTSGNGNWMGSLDLDVSSDFPEWTTFRIELNNILDATSTAGSTSFISKTLAGTQLEITIIPEPTSIALLLIGLVAIRRR
ncbi:MAG: PEP-CTERM sorting domain-containing protein [Phycisphaerae bacterium]|nr:PEP-CTERM sorting domain-containing protein [Phycisphaerae bacterium]